VLAERFSVRATRRLSFSLWMTPIEGDLLPELHVEPETVHVLAVELDGRGEDVEVVPQGLE